MFPIMQGTTRRRPIPQLRAHEQAGGWILAGPDELRGPRLQGLIDPQIMTGEQGVASAVESHGTGRYRAEPACHRIVKPLHEAQGGLYPRGCHRDFRRQRKYRTLRTSMSRVISSAIENRRRTMLLISSG